MRASEKSDGVGQEGGAAIEALLTQLHSHDGKVREQARWRLVALRGAAVIPLADALEDPDWHVRWEAAAALRDIADPRAAAALVETLRDRRFGVRWLASDALIALRGAALAPLLNTLIHSTDSLWLRNGAHHVLRDLSGGHLSREATAILKPLLAALEGVEPSVEVPLAARRALDELPKRLGG